MSVSSCPPQNKYVFTDDDSLFGGDLDHCIDPATGALDSQAATILKRFGLTYAEVSQSATGVKFIGHGKLPGDPESQRHKKALGGGVTVELYDRGRFFALTADAWGDHPSALADCQAELDGLYESLFGDDIRRAKSAAEHARTSRVGLDVDDAEAIDSLRRIIGEPFIRLYDHGDLSAADNDHRKANWHALHMIAWRVGPDEARIDRLCRGSALMRDKWDRNAGGGVSYGLRTIRKLIRRMTKYYDSGRPGRRFRFGRPSRNGHAGGENDAPTPVGGDGDVPTFPVDTLPGWLREWVAAEAEATQTPADLAAILG
jgi:primase-polymerase (primpol)-like protein